MSLRNIQRGMKKKKGELPHKKVVARKLGITVKELNKKLKRKELAK